MNEAESGHFDGKNADDGDSDEKKVYRNIIRIQVREFTIIPLLSPCARIP